MIKSLYIKNYAIISEVTVDFDRHLNIITGPSGSGKTLIVKALSFLVGSSLEKKFLSLENTVIEGIFIVNQTKYILRRVFNMKSTKNFINDEPMKISEYKKIATDFIDINDQREKYKLLDNEHHIEMLDSFANSNKDLNTYRKSYSNYSKQLNELKNLQNEKEKLKDKYDLYLYQLDELNQFPISESEESLVFKKLKKLLNHKEISNKVESLKELVSSNVNGLSPMINNIKSITANIKDYDDVFKSIDESIRSISIEINEINNDLDRYENSPDFSHQEIEELELRSTFYDTIKRKYGGTLESAVNYKRLIANKLDRYNNIDLEISNLNEIINTEEVNLLKMAKIIQKKRIDNKPLFLNKVKEGLKSLNMNNVEFDLEFITNTQLSINGLESCEFYISFNKGISKLPLKDVASGGELSRIVLIIKNVSTHLKTPIVFDEIDSGVSGEIADNLGKLLLNIAQKNQILCITHLPQVASKGNSHFYITKHSDSSRTYLNIRKLDGKSRVNEIAKMISLGAVQESGLKHAENILKN